MPLITNFSTGNEFTGSQSGWPNLTGTKTLNFDVLSSDSNTPTPQLKLTSGIAESVYPLPAKGNTVLSATTGTGTSLNVAPSATPGSNRLVLLCVVNQIASGTATEPTITAGCGLTWTKVTTQTYGTRRITVFRALGASPTSVNINVDFGSVSQARIYAWAYDFTNCYKVEATAVNASIQSSSTTSSSVTGTLSDPADEFHKTMFFFSRSATTGGTPTYTTKNNTTPTAVDYYSTGNSQGWGDVLIANTPANLDDTGYDTATITWAGTANNAIIGIRLIPSSSSSIKVPLCSSGTTQDNLLNGTIDFSFIYGGHRTLLTSGNYFRYPLSTPQFYFWTDSFTGPPSGYFLDISHTMTKSAGIGSGGNTGTITVALFSSGAGQLASAGAFTYNLTSSGFRPAGEEWKFSIVLYQQTATTVGVKIIYEIPPVPGGTEKYIGGLTYENVSNPSNLKYGVLFPAAESWEPQTTTNKKLGYLRVSDTASVPKAARIQAVNRSVVW
jgi:hypothetical protein